MKLDGKRSKPMKDNELLFIARLGDKAFGVTINPNDPGRWLTKAEHDAEVERRSTWTEAEITHHREAGRLHHNALVDKIFEAMVQIDDSVTIMITPEVGYFTVTTTAPEEAFTAEGRREAMRRDVKILLNIESRQERRRIFEVLQHGDKEQLLALIREQGGEQASDEFEY
jgi:hypothetical protein